MPTTSSSGFKYHRVLICGDRNWHEVMPIRRVILELHKKWGNRLVIIEGGARGVDTLAHHEALKRGIPVMTFDAPWELLPKAGGPVRNKWMLKIGKPHEAYAFHPDLTKSKGTKDMVELLEKAGIKVKRVIQ